MLGKQRIANILDNQNGMFLLQVPSVLKNCSQWLLIKLHHKQCLLSPSHVQNIMCDECDDIWIPSKQFHCWDFKQVALTLHLDKLCAWEHIASEKPPSTMAFQLWIFTLPTSITWPSRPASTFPANGLNLLMSARSGYRTEELKKKKWIFISAFCSFFLSFFFFLLNVLLSFSDCFFLEMNL